jgi:hypothetical protein
MLSDLMQRLRDYFEPYTLQEFIEEYGPADHHEVERLEKLWERLHNNRQFWF